MTDYDPYDDGEEPATDRSPDEREPRGKQFGLRLGLGIEPLTDLLHIEGSVDPASRPGVDEELEIIDEPPADEDVSGDYRVTTRRTETEFLVTADLPGVSEGDIEVGIGSKTNDLVIKVAGTTIERVELPWESVIATQVSYNNYILEVLLHPAGGADGEP